jgi:hypothetical protein
MQNVLDDVGGQLQEIFANPTIKKAYSILGNKSGEVRADKGLRNKVATKIIDQYPIVEKLLDQFDITAEEGLRLMQDPIIQPFIQGFLQNGLGGLGIGSDSSNTPNKSFAGRKLKYA